MVWQLLRQSFGIPIGTLLPLAGKHMKGFQSQKNSFRLGYLSAGRKIEFELEGIDSIRPSPEPEIPEIQSRFPYGK